jgi:EAL domain-containing protein (putative c-di-GMP-specific phosphodiesterase class I)/CheY-like chemotaxis protein
MARNVRILIVDDNPDFISWLSAVLSQTPGMEVSAAAFDPEQARRVAERTKPDVAIVDVVMPNGGGIRATKLIKTASRTTAVLIFSGAGDPNAVIEMLRLGALGYVAKTSPMEDIVSAIRAAARGVTVISPDMAISVRRELVKKAELDSAARIDESAAVERLLADRRFHVVFQPLVELATRKIRGFEALTRFPDGSPEEWFARAWRVGRGPELELAAIEVAFASVSRMPPDLYLSVNVSPATLPNRGLIELLEGCQPGYTVLEITEHAEIEDIESFIPALERVRAMGVRIAVDDAGAGFANFVRLLDVVPHVIKLDRVLVAGIDRDPMRVAIARSLITLANNIGAQVAGEGIETEEEAQVLTRLGVRFGQGYLFGRPESLPTAEEARDDFRAL